MDTQLIIFWVTLIVLGLGFDIGIYLFLRTDWRKNGVLRTDVWFDRIFDRLSQIRKAVSDRFAASLVRYYRDSVPSLATAPAFETAPVFERMVVAESEPEPVVDVAPVEIIPISVENVGQMRHIEFTLDLKLDSQVDVRIGATNEAGITIQKREL